MFSRRNFLGIVTSAVAVVLAGSRLDASAAAITSGAEKVHFQWRVPAPFADKAQEDLPFTGTADREDSKGFIVIIAGVVALVYLAKSILRMHDELEGGTVIDLRGEEILIERDRNLPGEYILLVTEDDKKLYERSEIESPDELVSALLGAK